MSSTYIHMCLVIPNSLRGAEGVPADGRRGKARRANNADRRGQAIESSALPPPHPPNVTLVVSLPDH